MSTEYIKEIIVREEGVFLHSKSSNDDLPYRTWRSDSLSEIYRDEGRSGLDREIMRMLCEYAQLRGSHSSLGRYAAVLKNSEARKLVQEHRACVDARFDAMPKIDRKRFYGLDISPAALAYREFEKVEQDQLYQALADLCAAPRKRDEPVR